SPAKPGDDVGKFRSPGIALATRRRGPVSRLHQMRSPLPHPRFAPQSPAPHHGPAGLALTRQFVHTRPHGHDGHPGTWALRQPGTGILGVDLPDSPVTVLASSALTRQTHLREVR